MNHSLLKNVFIFMFYMNIIYKWITGIMLISDIMYDFCNTIYYLVFKQ